MLYGMSHARHIIIVQEVPNLDINGCAGFIGAGVMDQKGFELIRQANHSIGAIIELWLIQTLGHPFKRGHSG